MNLLAGLCADWCGDEAASCEGTGTAGEASGRGFWLG